jgi:hypothetical protein
MRRTARVYLIRFPSTACACAHSRQLPESPSAACACAHTRAPVPVRAPVRPQPIRCLGLRRRAPALLRPIRINDQMPARAPTCLCTVPPAVSARAHARALGGWGSRSATATRLTESGMAPRPEGRDPNVQWGERVAAINTEWRGVGGRPHPQPLWKQRLPLLLLPWGRLHRPSLIAPWGRTQERRKWQSGSPRHRRTTSFRLLAEAAFRFGSRRSRLRPGGTAPRRPEERHWRRRGSRSVPCAGPSPGPRQGKWERGKEGESV